MTRTERIEQLRRLEESRKRVVKFGKWYTEARMALNAREMTQADFARFQAEYFEAFEIWNQQLVAAGYSN